jgi:outer membrane protein assembly factor BamB
MHKLLTTLLLAALIGTAGTAVARAGDWPQFRGPSGSGVSQEKDLPIKWSKTEGLRYKVELPGRGLSNPVVAGGRIYLTACSGYRERRLHVLCLDEETGKKLWERQFTATGSTACHPMTNMAAPTPVTDGSAVYALFATGDLAALDRDGTLLWYRSLVGDYPRITNQVGMAASPILSGNVLLVPMENAGDSFAAGIDKRTGKNLWKVKREKDINWVTPLVFSTTASASALFQSGNEAAAYDIATGNMLWSLKEKGFSTIPSPIQGKGLLFLTGGNFRAIRPPASGTKPAEVWSVGGQLGGFSSPVYYNGRIYNLTTVALTCLDAQTGKQLSRKRAEGPFDASPIVAGGNLYAVNRKGRTFVFDLSGDEPKQVARNDIDDTILATPAVANGCVYLRSDKYLYCIGALKGN